jgi:hypothetical protein
MAPYYAMMKLPASRRGVHPDAAVHAAAPRQPRIVDGRAQRRRTLWQVAGVPFPKQTLVFGPQQVVARINQDQVISPQIHALEPSRAPQVIQGTLMVIPIEGSLITCAPSTCARRRTHSRLTRVIVAIRTAS